MTLIAGRVRVRRIGMRGADGFVRVTGRAVALCAVMILVTRGARLHGCGGVKRHGRLVAGRAAQFRVGGVRKRDRTASSRMVGDRHRNRLRMDRSDIRRGVTLRAVVGGGRLMVTDLAAARRYKREPCVRPRGDVTGETGKLLVSSVGK